MRPTPATRPVRRPRGARWAVLLCSVLLAVVLPAWGAPAAAEGGEPRWGAMREAPRVERRKGGGAVTPSTAARRTAVDSSDPVTAPFVVSYRSAGGAPAWTSTQRAAMQRAVDVWSRLLVSSVPIEVDAVMEPLGTGVLGSAAPATIVQDDADGTWYPIALANALQDSDLNGSAPEIEASFPSDGTSIYYGTGTPPEGTYDFTSTAMHELGHGLGFLGSASVDLGGNDAATSDDLGYLGVLEGDPVVFDTFVVRQAADSDDPAAAVTPLTSLSDGTAALAAALQSRQLYWDGPAGEAAAGARRPELFAPLPWEDGSSFAHLDEAAYPAGTLNSLMTPVGDAREVNPEPGPIALGIMQDTGWQLSAAAQPPVPTRFTPVAPARVLDTRSGLGAAQAKVGAGGVVDLRVTGSVPTSTGATLAVPADATAVVLNVAGASPTTATDVRVYPRGASVTPVPTVSSLNLAGGRNRANLVTVKVGADGRVRLRNNSGTVHLLADLAGWYTPSGATSYFPVSPERVLDTRPGAGNEGAPAAKVPAGGVVELQVAGVAGVAPTPDAVVLGVTLVNVAVPTHVTAYPEGAAPEASSINAYPGAPTPGLVIVRVGADGKVRLRNNSGAVDLLADVYGWFDDTGSGALFRALTPDRVVDTRLDVPASAPSPRVGPGGSFDVDMAGAGGVGATATAVVLNVTGTGGSAPTDVRVYPAPAGSSAPPTVSTLNLATGQTAADAAIVPLGDGSEVRFFNSSGSVAVIADVAGWFAP